MSCIRVHIPAIGLEGWVASGGARAPLGEPLELAAGVARVEIALCWRSRDICVDGRVTIELEIAEGTELAIRLPIDAVLALARLALRAGSRHEPNQRGTSSSAGPA